MLSFVDVIVRFSLVELITCDRRFYGVNILLLSGSCSCQSKNSSPTEQRSLFFDLEDTGGIFFRNVAEF
jgi:hypothetical protein